MSKNDEYTRCKQCGKVIVGGGKMGLCDSCFNADAEKGLFAVGVGAVVFKFRKQIVNGLKTLIKLIK